MEIDFEVIVAIGAIRVVLTVFAPGPPAPRCEPGVWIVATEAVGKQNAVGHLLHARARSADRYRPRRAEQDHHRRAATAELPSALGRRLPPAAAGRRDDASQRDKQKCLSRFVWLLSSECQSYRPGVSHRLMKVRERQAVQHDDGHRAKGSTSNRSAPRRQTYERPAASSSTNGQRTHLSSRRTSGVRRLGAKTD